MIKISIYLCLSLYLISCDNESVFGGYNKPNAFDGIGMDNPFGLTLPLDVSIITSNEKSSLTDFFNNNGLPKLFLLGYYNCPMLCNSVRDNLFSQLKQENIKLGQDYEIIMLSINPDETIEDANNNRDVYFNRYFLNEYNTKEYFNFLISSEQEVIQLTKEIGFEYEYDEESNEYFHPAFVYIVSDQGIITDGLQFGSLGSDFKGKLVSAKNNVSAMNFDDFYAFTCLQKDIENKNPQNAFSLLKFTSLFFVSIIAFGLGYNFLITDRREEK